MSKFWSDRVKTTKPYTYGEQPKDKKYIKLNTNENPYPVSGKAIDAMKAAVNDDLKLYPDPTCLELRTQIAAYYGVDKDEVFVGNGSDEVLAFSFMAFFNRGDKVIYPDISYSFYDVYAGLFGVESERIPLEDDFSIPVEKYKNRNVGILIANPNAPTGICLGLDEIEEIVASNPHSLVLVDEAYIDFGGDTAIGLTKKYDNLLVSQTFSKSRSLAGMRVGFAIGDKKLIEALERIKNSINSYTIDRIAIAGATASMIDVDHFESTRNLVIKTRERVVPCLEKLGFRVLPSKANFIFATHKSISGQTLYEQLKHRGILVRHFAKPRIEDYLRISIGSDDEMDAFLSALEDLVKSLG